MQLLKGFRVLFLPRTNFRSRSCHGMTESKADLQLKRIVVDGRPRVALRLG